MEATPRLFSAAGMPAWLLVLALALTLSLTLPLTLAWVRPLSVLAGLAWLWGTFTVAGCETNLQFDDFVPLFVRTLPLRNGQQLLQTLSR